VKSPVPTTSAKVGARGTEFVSGSLGYGHVGSSRRPLTQLVGLVPTVLLLSGLLSVWAGPLAASAAATTGDSTQFPNGRTHMATDARPATANGDWTQFHNGPTHEGFNTDESTLSASNVPRLRVAWTGTTGSGIGFSSPAVADGVVYVGSEDGKLYAYAVGCASAGASCTPIWTGTTGGYIYWSSPAVADGVVYVGSEDGKLYAYAVGCASGGGSCTSLWTGATGSGIESSPAVADGVVYVGSGDKKLYAYAVGCASGGGSCTPLWTGATGSGIWSSPAVADGVVYVGSYTDKKLYAYAVGCASGGGSCMPLWTGDTDLPIASSPAVADGVVYVGSYAGSYAGKLYAFDAKATFAITGIASSAVKNVVLSFAVTAKDSFGNTDPSYQGTVHFTSSDPLATLPSDYTFVAADAGSHQFTLTFGAEGSQSITVADVAQPSITSNQTERILSAAPGTVVAWGHYYYGQTTVPTGLSGVIAIAAGGWHSLALKSDGTVVGWGDNANGQSTVPAGLSGVTAIAAGADHSLALKSNGTVLAWGNSAMGQTKVPAGLSGVTAIAAGDQFSLALKSNGTVVGWGDNYYGQTTVPAGLSGVTAIAAGDQFSLALKSDGTVVGWGDNYYGQTTVPAGLSGVTAIAARDQFSLALKSDGTVVAWGYDFFGQTDVSSGLSGVGAIAAGGSTSYALGADASAPTDGSALIDGGAAYTNSTSITLTLSASDDVGVAQMRLSQDAGFSGAAWRQYATTAPFTINGGDGSIQTVYAQFRDFSGHLSDVVSDSILLDLEAPSSSVNALPASELAMSFMVGWTGSDATSGVATYDVQVRDDGVTTPGGSGTPGTWTPWLTATTATSLSFEGLAAHRYCFRSRATDAAGNVEAWRVDPDTCTRVTDTAAPAPGSVVIDGGAVSTNSTAVTLALTATDNIGVTEMRVSEDLAFAGVTWQPFATSLPFILSAGGGTHTVYAQFRDADGNASDVVSDSIVLNTVPGNPMGVTASPRNASAVVSWTAPADDGGAAIIAYTVTSDPDAKTCAWTSGPLSCTVTGLTNGTPYTFTVAATTAVGTGPASSPSSSVTPVTPPMLPGPPAGVSAVAGNASAVVSWTAPADDGGSPVSAYTITSNPGSRTCGWSSGPLTCTVTGLTNGQAYTFSVTATNGVGTGPASAASNSVTPVASAIASTYTPISPRRVLDTRPTVKSGNPTNIGLSGKCNAGVVRKFTVAGAHYVGGGTAPAIPANAVAITGNLTIVNETAAGVIDLGPAVSASGSTSTLSFVKGDIRANNVTVGLAADGSLSAVYRSSTAGATTDLIFDVTGYFTPNTAGATYHIVTPGRILDTRPTGSSGATHIGPLTKLANRTVKSFPVAGVKALGGTGALVPVGAVAVTGNITVTNATSAGYVSLGPTMTANPSTSTVNVPARTNVANGVTVALKGGKLSVVWCGTTGSSTDVIFDVTGYFTADASGLSFYALTPVRLLDSSVNMGLTGPFANRTARLLGVGGTSTIPSGAAAIAGNLTLITPSSGGFVLVSPEVVASPTTSTVNASAGRSEANGFDVALGSGGHVALEWAGTVGSTANLALDVTGYWK
jgi:outer membrane protein assembly factor BamB